MQSGYTKIGFFKKPHALAGSIRLSVEESYWSDLHSVSVIFTEKEGKVFPYFIENLKGDGRQVVIKLEDISSPEEARLLTGKEIWLRNEDLQQAGAKQEESDFTGFTVMDKQVGEIGKILETIEYPQQLMAVIQKDDKEILIPLVDAFIVDIETKRQLITVDLPEGLLDLY